MLQGFGVGAAIKYEFSKFYAISEIFENYGTFPLIRVGGVGVGVLQGFGVGVAIKYEF